MPTPSSVTRYAVVESGLATFVDVGRALLEIRDQRLYRERGYERFEDYCKGRFNLAHSHTHRLIEAAETYHNLSPMGEVAPPESERQVRPLVQLTKKDPEAAAEVWRQVREEFGEDVTARQVRAAVDQRLGIIRSVAAGSSWATALLQRMTVEQRQELEEALRDLHSTEE